MAGGSTRPAPRQKGPASHRQAQPGAQAALGRFVERQVAAMAAHDVAGDRQAEADPAGRGIARALDPVERLEDLLALALRDAPPLIVAQELDSRAAPAGL